MKKIITYAILILSIFGLTFTYSNTYAEEDTSSGNDTVEVVVTTKIPGADCEEKDGKIVCNVGKGFSTVVLMIGKIIKYFTYIASLGGVLYIIINGIMYSMAGIDSAMKDEAKKRIGKTIGGLILLFLSGSLLYIVAPWVYTF